MKILKSPQAMRGMVLLIIAVAFLWRTAMLAGQSLWRDEVDVILFSSWPLPDLLRGLFNKGHNGPLFYVLLRPWRAIVGDSEFALRYPSAMLGTLVIPLGFMLARELRLNSRIGVLLGVLMATSPYLIWYSQEAKMYTLLLALVMFAFIAYWRAWRTGSKFWWAAFVVTTSLSFYSHILSPLMLTVYGIMALIHFNQGQAKRRAWLISIGCLTVPYLPLVWWQIGLLHQGIDSGHPFYDLTTEIYALLKVYSGGLTSFNPPTDTFLIILYIFLFLSGTIFSVRNFSVIFILATWVFLPTILIYLISLRVTVFEDRYLIYITPPFYLLVVLGLTNLQRYSRQLASFGLGIILMFNLIGTWQQQRQPIKADFRAAAAYITQQANPPVTIMMQIPYLQHTLRYYYPALPYPNTTANEPYKLLEGLWTNDHKTEQTVDAEMTMLTAPFNDIWLVVSEEDMWDSRGLTRAWFQHHAKLIDEAHFNRVEVYHYRLGTKFD